MIEQYIVERYSLTVRSLGLASSRAATGKSELLIVPIISKDTSKSGILVAASSISDSSGFITSSIRILRTIPSPRETNKKNVSTAICRKDAFFVQDFTLVNIAQR